MSNISGLVPYQKMLITAKANGGPSQYLFCVYNKGFVDGARAATTNSYAGTYISIGASIGVGAFIIGSWIHKKIKSHKNSKQEDTE